MEQGAAQTTPCVIGALPRNVTREFRGNHSCAVPRRWAFQCNGRAVNLLIQLEFQNRTQLFSRDQCVSFPNRIAAFFSSHWLDV